MTEETNWNTSSLHGFVRLPYLLFDVVAAHVQDQEVVAQVADRHTCTWREKVGYN